MAIQNLLKEIEEHTDLNEIEYVLIGQAEVDKDWFLKQAARIEYDNGHGGEIINGDLKIVLKDDSWLERREYDGAEWFVRQKKPERSNNMVEEDLGVLFQDRHHCPYNTARIDGMKITNTRSVSDHYMMWFERNGQIEVESHAYNNEGNYKSEHRKLMRTFNE